MIVSRIYSDQLKRHLLTNGVFYNKQVVDVDDLIGSGMDPVAVRKARFVKNNGMFRLNIPNQVHNIQTAGDRKSGVAVVHNYDSDCGTQGLIRESRGDGSKRDGGPGSE